jgi:pimeloyl-ACP methyl ester carboxylesterase
MTPSPPAWRTVRVDRARVRVLEAGPDGGAPLLFLHGWGLSPRSYASGVLRLADEGVRVVAPCLPGFGGSDAPPLAGLDLPGYARRVGRLLDVLGLDGPVAVAGHSFGGGVALQLAADRPDLVRSLTLVNTVGGAGRAADPWPDAATLRWALGTALELDPRALATLPSVLRDLVPNLLRRPLTLALTARVALRASLADSARDLVASGLPVQFVWGTHDHLVPPGALAAVSGPSPHEVVGGGHGWLLARPAELSALLRTALDAHGAPSRPAALSDVPVQRGPRPVALAP